MMTWVAEQWISMGFQVCTHCIGDRGNSVVLNAYHDAVASLGVCVERGGLRRKGLIFCFFRLKIKIFD